MRRESGFFACVAGRAAGRIRRGLSADALAYNAEQYMIKTAETLNKSPFYGAPVSPCDAGTGKGKCAMPLFLPQKFPGL
jgi:hypothetical protein